MEIVIKKSNYTVTFKDILPGHCFQLMQKSDNVFMKTMKKHTILDGTSFTSVQIIAVCLNNGQVTTFIDNHEVIPVNAVLTVTPDEGNYST